MFASLVTDPSLSLSPGLFTRPSPFYGEIHAHESTSDTHPHERSTTGHKDLSVRWILYGPVLDLRPTRLDSRDSGLGSKRGLLIVPSMSWPANIPLSNWNWLGGPRTRSWNKDGIACRPTRGTPLFLSCSLLPSVSLPYTGEKILPDKRNDPPARRCVHVADQGARGPGHPINRSPILNKNHLFDVVRRNFRWMLLFALSIVRLDAIKGWHRAHL